MDLHLTVTPSDVVRLYVNGVLHAEITVGVTDTRDTLLAQVQAARGLARVVDWVEALPGVLDTLDRMVDSQEKTPLAKEAAYLRGLCEGLAGRTRPYPDRPDLPPLPPEDGPAYRLGYAQGEAFRRVVALGHAVEVRDGHPTA
jgi:hypothetical protein